MGHFRGLFSLLIFCIAILGTETSFAAVFNNAMEGNSRLRANAEGIYEICWFGKAESVTADLRGKIETYLLEQLTQRAGFPLKFVGDCLTYEQPFFPVGLAFFDAADNPPGIQNTITGTATQDFPGHPTAHSKGWLNHMDLVDVILTAHFQSVRPGLVEQSKNLSPQGAENLQVTIALHEFLHTLGFEHEQDRADSPCTGNNEYTEGFDMPITEYDSQSIMNYCYTHAFDFEMGKIPLSDLDIKGLQEVYLSDGGIQLKLGP